MYSRFRRGYGRMARGSKYSTETMTCRLVWAASSVWAQSMVVGPAQIQGVRKVKNFTVTVPGLTGVEGIWALVYVPEGLTMSQFNLPSGDDPKSLYEPNQNVIMAGRTSNVTQVVRSRLARNLGSGDAIYLGIIVDKAPTAQVLTYIVVSYAIKFG